MREDLVRETVAHAMQELAKDGHLNPSVDMLDSFLTTDGLMDSSEIKRHLRLILDARKEITQKNNPRTQRSGRVPNARTQPTEPLLPTPDASPTSPARHGAEAKDREAQEAESGVRRLSFDKTGSSFLVSLYRKKTPEFALAKCKYHPEKESYIRANTLLEQDIGGHAGAMVELQWTFVNQGFGATGDQAQGVTFTLFKVLSEEDAERSGMDFDILFGTDHTAEIAHQRDTQLPDKNVGLGEAALPYPGSAQGQFQQSIVGEHAASGSSTSHLSSGPPVIRSQNGTVNLNIFHFHYGQSSNKALNSQDISAVSQLLQEVSVDPKAGIGAPRGYQPQRAASFSSSVGSSSSLGASDGSQIGAGSSQSRMSSAMPKHSNGAGKRPHEGGVESSRPDSKRHQVSDPRNGHSDEKQASQSNSLE